MICTWAPFGGPFFATNGRHVRPLGSSTTPRERLTLAFAVLYDHRCGQVPLEVRATAPACPGHWGRTRVRLCNTTGTPQVALRWSCRNEHATREIALDALADLSSLCRVAALPGQTGLERSRGVLAQGCRELTSWVSATAALGVTSSLSRGHHTAELWHDRLHPVRGARRVA